MSVKTYFFNHHLVMDETEAPMSLAARVPLNNELILSRSIFSSYSGVKQDTVSCLSGIYELIVERSH